MFFTASKVFWILSQPGNLLLIGLCLGVVLMARRRWRKAGRRLMGVTVGAGLVVAVLPLGPWMIGPLEDRFPPLAETPDRVHGIVVLGGIVDPVVTESRGRAALGGAVERLMAFARLARQYPKAKLVFSGGSGSLTRQDLKEARFVDPVLRDLGLEAGRVMFEDQARNTHENAVLSRKLAAPKPGETWILITSAFHMPRAVGAFRVAGWTVLPYPVDFITPAGQTAGLQFNFAGGLGAFGAALHEWLGLAFYRLSGKTDAFFPAPSLPDSGG